MPNIVIPLEHQSAPTIRYDPVLAREAAAAADPAAAGRRDWDRFDAEMDAPGHHDQALELLRQRAYVQRIARRPQAWVDESLELWEANCDKARGQQLPEQERWQGEARERERLTRIMHPNEVKRRLRAAGVDARTERHRDARIWLNEWSTAGLVGVNAWVKPQEMEEEGYLLALREAASEAQRELITANYAACREGRKVQKTLTSLQEPYGPEWSIMRFNDHCVATKEKYRGWRTAMLVLIVAEIVTEAEVDRAFGPAIGEAGAWYRHQLQVWRQIRVGRAI
jgi:hypothetical protein